MTPLSLLDITNLIGRLAGIDDVRSIDEMRAAFAAPWARGGAAWVVFACAALAALAFLFYFRCQGRSRAVRVVLATARAAVLALLVVMLAEPILTLKLTSTPKPLLWVLLDGTESMGIADDLPDGERAELARAAGLPADAGNSKPSRADHLKALLARKEANLLDRLGEKFRLQAFLFDRPDGARLIGGESTSDRLDPEAVAREVTAAGGVTAIGAALSDLASRHATANLAGILVASDFDQNSGPPAGASARKLGAPVFTLGLGPPAAVDLRIGLRAPLLMKKAERSTVVAVLSPSGLAGRTARVRVSARRPGTEGAGAAIPIGERDVTLGADEVQVDFPFTPSESGRFIIAAEAEKIAGEAAEANNRAEREVSILDDFLRLLFVEYEPTWEWRFIKEVFHRDKLVGQRGFRTFLRSADPKVRQSNSLFLATLTPMRSDFFSTDVIFLGDMPGHALSPRFIEMTREFVSTFGGGLVVLSGPRFGPSGMAGTPLAEMLPVVVDPDLRLRSDREFRLRLTPEAALADFMSLGGDEAESAKAWADLGLLPWYQPVARLHPLATCLAEHPTETCADGKTPQPLIAIRRFGRGEVVWLGFNETWRLRRKHGETYYRQFWGQMIHRLGLSHAIGSGKRFVVRSDRQEYGPDDTAVITVEAFDANFEPLAAEKIPDQPSPGGRAGTPKLAAEIFLPGRPQDAAGQPVPVPALREGLFEARVPLLAAGEHRLRVRDPVTNEDVEIAFNVTSLSAEKRSVVRNVAVEEDLVRTTEGKRYDLLTIDRLPDEIRPPARTETTIRVIPLWNTWLCFSAVVALCLGEWLLRKLVNLQ